jgi:hypothetical protein
MIVRSIVAGVALFALAACNGAGGGTAVPKTDADKQKLAAEIATLMSDPKMLDGMVDSMKMSMEPMLTAGCDMAPADKRAECLTKMEAVRPVMQETLNESMEQSKAMMPALMQDMGAIMARLYTGEELAKMMDFYSSPEGKSISAKLPQVMAEYMPKAMERMQGMQMEMMGKMQQRLMKAMQEPTAQPTP